jgi:hypothetical protein
MVAHRFNERIRDGLRQLGDVLATA